MKHTVWILSAAALFWVGGLLPAGAETVIKISNVIGPITARRGNSTVVVKTRNGNVAVNTAHADIFHGGRMVTAKRLRTGEVVNALGRVKGSVLEASLVTDVGPLSGGPTTIRARRGAVPTTSTASSGTTTTPAAVAVQPIATPVAVPVAVPMAYPVYGSMLYSGAGGYVPGPLPGNLGVLTLPAGRLPLTAGFIRNPFFAAPPSLPLPALPPAFGMPGAPGVPNPIGVRIIAPGVVGVTGGPGITLPPGTTTTVPGTGVVTTGTGGTSTIR